MQCQWTDAFISKVDNNLKPVNNTLEIVAQLKKITLHVS